MFVSGFFVGSIEQLLSRERNLQKLLWELPLKKGIMKINNSIRYLKFHGLYFIILLALIVKLVYFISLQPWRENVVASTVLVKDAVGYHQLALSVGKNKSFENFGAFRTPGYPVFLALCYWLFSGKIWLVLLVQVCISVCSVLLVYRIAVLVFSRRIGLLSAFLCAVDQGHALYAVSLLTETIYVFFILVSVYFLCRHTIKNSTWTIGCSALFLGIATLIRPISVVLPVVVIIYILVTGWQRIKITLAYALVFGVVFICSISPWLLHNYSVYGAAQLSSISGSNLLFENIAFAETYKTGAKIEDVRKNFRESAIKHGIDTTGREAFKNSKIYSDLGQDYIKDNFFYYCKIHFIGIANMFAGLGAQPIFEIFHLGSQPRNIGLTAGPDTVARLRAFYGSVTIAEMIIMWGICCYLAINYFFALYSFRKIFQNGERVIFLFLLIILYFSVLTGAVGNSRYRIPMMPFINILCAVGITQFLSNVIEQNRSLRYLLQKIKK
jgi:4-amino-4-deoxy-L-arabinose transferase-like glycosyltransferase